MLVFLPGNRNCAGPLHKIPYLFLKVHVTGKTNDLPIQFLLFSILFENMVYLSSSLSGCVTSGSDLTSLCLVCIISLKTTIQEVVELCGLVHSSLGALEWGALEVWVLAKLFSLPSLHVAGNELRMAFRWMWHAWGCYLQLAWLSHIPVFLHVRQSARLMGKKSIPPLEPQADTKAKTELNCSHQHLFLNERNEDLKGVANPETPRLRALRGLSLQAPKCNFIKGK